MSDKKKRRFSEEHIHKLSEAHKGQVSWRKGKIFVPLEEQKRRRRVYRRKWRKENVERLRAKARREYANNPEKHRKVAREYYRNNRQRELDRIRKNKYGIDGVGFRKIMKQQNNKCLICNEGMSKNLSVDHDHKTGEIRGVICNSCNLAIGNAHSSPRILRALADYLEEFERSLK